MQQLEQVLALDRAGNPNAWIDIESAVLLVATGRVLAPLGAHVRVIYGGVNARSGWRSHIDVSSILLTRARVRAQRWTRDYAPPLTNRALFARDGHLCLYCGEAFGPRALTRDHVIPLSRGGRNDWTNVATACRHCNARKKDRTPEEWGVELLALPYAPCHAEHLLLCGRTVLADQMAFLRARLRRRASSAAAAAALLYT